MLRIRHRARDSSQIRISTARTSTDRTIRTSIIRSLVLGIISIVFIWGGFSGFVSLILSVIGLVLASSAKKDGFNEGIRTAGFVTCLIGLIGGLLALLACVACVGALGAVSSSREFERAADDFFYNFYGKY